MLACHFFIHCINRSHIDRYFKPQEPACPLFLNLCVCVFVPLSPSVLGADGGGPEQVRPDPRSEEETQDSAGAAEDST